MDEPKSIEACSDDEGTLSERGRYGTVVATVGHHFSLSGETMYRS